MNKTLIPSPDNQHLGNHGLKGDLHIFGTIQMGVSNTRDGTAGIIQLITQDQEHLAT